MSVCLSVRYAFSPCDSYSHQTFHDGLLGPGEGGHRVRISKRGWGGGLGEVHPSHAIGNICVAVMPSAAKLSTMHA